MIRMVFGYFLEFGASNRLIIAYLDRPKWYARFSHRVAFAGSSKIQKNAFLNEPNSQETGFLPIFLQLRASY